MRAFQKLGWLSSLALSLSLSAAGCGDDDETKDNGSTAMGGTEPVYVLQMAIYGEQETLNYVFVDHELNFNIDEARLTKGRELEGYTTSAAVGGKLLLADGAAPFVRRYEVADDLTWTEIGEPLNFSAYPMDMWNYMNFYFQKFKDQDTAYFFYDSNKTSRVRWSIKDWKILDDHQDTAIPAPPAGWAISNGGNRTGIGNYQGPVMQGFTYYNEELGTTYEKSWIAVYDETTHQERVIESNCPSLEQSTMDKDGNVFFSTTYYSPLYALYGTGPAPCVIKMKADGTLDESYAPNDLRSYTGGFYGVNYRDLGNGKAVANVLHHDRIEGANFAGGQLEDAVVTQVDEDNTLWELHVIDLASGTSKIVSEGFVDGHDLGSYATYSQVDGRTFIFVQIYPDVGPQTSAIYELDANAAKVTLVGRAPGDIWGMERLR